MRVAGRLAADVLDMIGPRIAAGMTTGEIDRICHDYIVNVQHAIPAPLNYKGFPKSICTSVNHVVCHGIPGDKVLKAGRHPQCGHHGHQGRLPRRHQPHVPGRRHLDPGPAAVRHRFRGHVARHPDDPPGHPPRRPRPHHPGLRRGPGLFGRARILRPRHRPGLPRGPAGPALRRAGHRPGARGRHDLHRRAHGQCRAGGT